MGATDKSDWLRQASRDEDKAVECAAVECRGYLQEGGSSDHGATEDWAFKTRTPYIHEIPHLRIRCVSLRYIAHDCGTLPAGLSDSPESKRAETWPADTLVREKLYGPVENLQRTAAYVCATGVPV